MSIIIIATSNDSIFPAFSTETAFAALRGREACNPVLRQQSLSLLQIYESK